MQPIDPVFLMESATGLRACLTLNPQSSMFLTVAKIDQSDSAMNTMLIGSVYASSFRPATWTAAQKVWAVMRDIKSRFNEHATDDSQLGVESYYALVGAYNTFETLFFGDLQSTALFHVKSKGGYEPAKLISGDAEIFPAALPAKVPEAMNDLANATRCIAFELWTAAGFHLHRAHEAVLRRYWDAVTNGEKRPNQQNMGVFISRLKDRNAGSPTVVVNLEAIKDLHRNPLMHPDQTLTSMEEALDLFGSIRSSIGYMLREIPGGVTVVV